MLPFVKVMRQPLDGGCLETAIAIDTLILNLITTVENALGRHIIHSNLE